MKQIQSCSDSWATKLSIKFNADSRIMAVSGKGVLQNAYGVLGPKMGSLYTRTTDNSKPLSYRYQDKVIPDAIFIFIGSNDYSHIVAPNAQNFVQAYT
jgi:lysophospholipase L1-like esterase